MKDLIARLESAEEPSQELDEAIAILVFGEPVYAVLPGGQRSKVKLFRYGKAIAGNKLMGNLVPPYTASIDAALTLGRSPSERLDIMRLAINELWRSEETDPSEHLARFVCIEALGARP